MTTTQNDNSKYIEELIKSQSEKLKSTHDKLEKINTELLNSGYYVDTDDVEEEKVPLSLTSHPKTDPIISSIDQQKLESINKKRLSKLESMKLQLELLEKEIRNAEKLDVEVQSLKEKLKEYESESEHQRKIIHEKEQQIKALNEQLKLIPQLEKLSTKMRYQLEKTEEEANLFKSIANKTKNELDSSQEQSNKLKQNLNILESQSKQLQSMLMNSQDTTTKLNEQIKQKLQPEIIKYKEKVAQQADQLEVAKNLTDVIKNLNLTLDDIRSDNEHLRLSTAHERDNLSKQRLKDKEIFTKYQRVHSELTIIALESMQNGKIVNISDDKLRYQTFGLAIQALIEEVKNDNITQFQMRKYLNSLDNELLINSLKTLSDLELPTQIGETVKIGDILNGIEKKSKNMKDLNDIYGICHYLLQI